MSEELSEVKSLTAYNLIRELILSGEALPGSRLVLADLENKLNVGRGPIREALMRLDKSGLVQNIPYKGAIVTPPPSYKEMEYIYEIRVQIETLLALEAMRNAKASDIAKLKAISLEMKDDITENSFFFQKDREFHSELYSLAEMPHLQMLVTSLLDHVEIFLNTRYYGKQDKDFLVAQHLEVIEYLKNHDEDNLKKALRKNILVGLELIQTEMNRLAVKKQIK